MQYPSEETIKKRLEAKRLMRVLIGRKITSENVLIVNNFCNREFPKNVIFNNETYVFGTIHSDGHGIYYKCDWIYGGDS